ncbi:DUF1499 domain-containing protein [Spongiibacter tropicus]|uniref:DUF1499 domain-containing protein n=1 Tax=Spongiibacter tropicus TaxID=454602 RepID=UPI0024E2164D|nr:DUF1499 domain-containing protein [Spongiibacter tropicus]
MKISSARHIFLSLALPVTVSLGACSAPPAVQQLEKAPELAPCPSSPNCVSSLSRDDSQYVPAFTANTADDWQRLQSLLLSSPRSYPLARADHYLHVEVRSALLRFRDDVELRYSPEQQRIDVRSASRLGHYDFGVNRQRVDALRARYEQPPP